MLMRFLVCAMLLLPTALLAQDKAPRKDLALKGDAQCTRCHHQDEEYPVLAIAQTKHGTLADGRTPTCTSCHGASDTHVNRPPDAKVRPKPDRVFSRKAGSPPEVQNEACLTCHQGGKRIHWQMSAHASRDVSCSSCHKVHAAHDPVRDKLAQSETCFACHKEQRLESRKSSRHPLLEGKVACSDCHNPHGTAGEKMLVRDTVNDTCYACHMEKRGPFVRTHQPVQENCAICHNPHGTSQPNLLRTRPPFLCQQCHEPTQHRATIPSAAPVVGAPGTAQAVVMARGCVNCHTNIHGSNHPINNSNERAFRR